MSVKNPDLLRLTHDLRGACGLLFTLFADLRDGFYIPSDGWDDAARGVERIRCIIKDIESIARGEAPHLLEKQLRDSRTHTSD